MTDVQATALVTPLPPSPPPKSDELPPLMTTDSDIAATEEDITANTDTSGNTSSDCLQADQKAQQSLPTSESSSSSSTTTTSIMPSTSSSTRTSLADDTTEQPPVIKKGILLIRPPPIARSASSPPSVSSSSTALPATSNSTPPTPSITFAPLPTLEPRRRTSSVQLGVAARSSMLRARRMRLIALGPLEGETDAPTSRKAEMINEMGGMLGGGIPGLEGFHGGKRIYGDGTHRVQYAAMVREAAGPGGVRGGQQKAYGWPEDKDDEGSHSGTASRRPSTTRLGGVGSSGVGSREGEEEEEDAFVTLGRMVRGGAKTLWRSLSVGSMREKEKRDEKRAAEGEKDKEKNRNVGGTESGEDLSDTSRRPKQTRSGSDSKASLHEEEVTVRVLVDEPLVNEPRNLSEVQTPQSSQPSPTSSQTEHHHKQLHHHPIEKQDCSENEEYDVVDVEEVVEVEVAEVEDAEEVEEEEEEEEEEGKVWIEQVDDNALQRRIERAQQMIAEQGKTKRGLKGRLSSLRIGGGRERGERGERVHGGVLVR